MYQIKRVFEDFSVIERFNLPENKGDHAYYLLKKKGRDFYGLLSDISKKLRIPVKKIRFAGIKDKYAVTEQYLSILKGPKRTIEGDGYKLIFLRCCAEPISVGMHCGNHFIIIVRNIKSALRHINWTINYFDEQRFSSNNMIIGKLLIQRKFSEAAKKLKLQGFKINAQNALESLQKIPKQKLLLFIHAYQSYLWNETVSRYLASVPHLPLSYSLGTLRFPCKKPSNIKIPMLGFGTETSNVKVDVIIKQLMLEEGITLRDFVIKQLPSLSAEGAQRDLVIKIDDIKIGQLEDDELNEGMKKVAIEFTLSKGCYATIIIKHLFLLHRGSNTSLLCNDIVM